MLIHPIDVIRILAVPAVLSLVIALLSGGIFAALQFKGFINWRVPAHGARPEKRMSSIWLLLSSWIGSIVGVILAVVSLILAEKWDYLLNPNVIHDGQEGLVVIISAPVCGLLGGFLAVVGCRLVLCSSSGRLWSAPWLYSGSRGMANMSVASAVLLALLGGLFLCGFLLNWFFVHPGSS
ncbi:MAG: hypothetical protein WCA11_05735 [Terracidiphilus sp.]